MESVLNNFELTSEAQNVLSDFVSRIRKHAKIKSIDSDSVEDLISSLAEHIVVVLRDMCDKRKVAVVDAQLLLEILLPLGTPEELVEALGSPSAGEASASASETNPSPAISTGKVRREYIFTPPRMLKRSKKDCWVLGVCGGVAEYWGISSTLLRLLVIFSGIGPVVYIIMGLLMPPDDSPDRGSSAEEGRFIGKIGSLLKFIFVCFMIVCLYLPMAAAFLGIAAAGCCKILSEIGFLSLNSGNLWFHFVRSVPGYAVGFAILLAGLSLFALLTQFFTSIFFNRSILNVNTRKLLIIVVMTGVVVCGILGLPLNLMKKQVFSEKNFHEFEPSRVKKLHFMFSSDKTPYNSRDIQIFGDSKKSKVEVEVIKNIGGWNEEDAKDKLKSLEYLCNLSEDGILEISSDISKPSWWFYPYPEILLRISVPQNQVCEIYCDKRGDFGKGVKTLNFSGPIRGDRISLNSLVSPNIVIDSDIVDVEMQYIQAEKLAVETAMGRIKCRDIEAKYASFKSAIGSIDILRAACDEIWVSSNIGALSLNSIDAAKAVLTTNTGSINADIYQLRPNSEFAITSEIGSIKLKLPEDSRPKLSIHTEIGSVSNDFKDIEAASDAARFHIQSQIGGIKIKRFAAEVSSKDMNNSLKHQY